MAFKAAEDSKQLSLPQTPDAYKIDLPADFKPPAGIDFKFKQDDPLLSQAKAMAHEMHLPQEQFSKLLGLYAGAQVATQQQIETARQSEISKLGTTGPARVTAITTFFKAMVGDAEGAQFASRMFTASDIQIAEKFIARFTSQGAGSFRQTGRDGEPAGRIPAGADGEAIWNKMTYSEKKEYSEKFSPANGAGAQR